MAYDNDFLLDLLERTNHRCHLCGGKVTAHHYGCTIRPTGWEVDHDVPRARGGDDHPDNLFAAHVSCNRSKRADSSELFRALSGLARRPMSAEEQSEARLEAAVGVGLLTATTAATIATAVEPIPEKRLATAVKWGFGIGLVAALIAAAVDPE